MLLKKNRIIKKRDFDRIFKKGISFKEKFLILKITSSLFTKSRFAFIVSQKVSKNAIIRNRIKRQLRELIRPMADKIKENVDGVFIALPGLGEKEFREIKETISSLLKKAKLI